MTDETHVLSQSGDRFTVRGFHGDYEVRVSYQGQERGDVQNTFTLGKQSHKLSLNVQWFSEREVRLSSSAVTAGESKYQLGLLLKYVI